MKIITIIPGVALVKTNCGYWSLYCPCLISNFYYYYINNMASEITDDYEINMTISLYTGLNNITLRFFDPNNDDIFYEQNTRRKI